MAYFDKNKFELTSNISLVVFSPPHSNFIKSMKKLVLCNDSLCSNKKKLKLFSDQFSDSYWPDSTQKLIGGVFECSLLLGASHVLLYEPCELCYLFLKIRKTFWSLRKKPSISTILITQTMAILEKKMIWLRFPGNSMTY